MIKVSRKRSHSNTEQEMDASGTVATKRRAMGTPSSSQESVSLIQWSTLFGDTCLFGEHGAVNNRKRLALFDLDGTLITTKSGARHSTASKDWRWLYAQVPGKLRQLHSDGYTIIIVTNQMSRSKLVKREEYYSQWKIKLSLMAKELHDVPFRVLASTMPDWYRKPLPGMWYAIEKLYEQSPVTLARGGVIFVGNAAGRLNPKDHSASDRLFALNVGVQFSTPEEFFLGAVGKPYNIEAFHPSSLSPNSARYQPSRVEIAPLHKKKFFLVIFVGFPAIGKTTLYRKEFESKGFLRVSQSSLGSMSKCCDAIEKALKAKKSVVVDDTNADKDTRREYLNLGNALGADVRCVYFEGSAEHAWHNNVYRAYCMNEVSRAALDSTELVAETAYRGCKPLLQNSRDFKTDLRAEGYAQVHSVYWVFDGSDDDYGRYMMWLFQLGQH